MTSKQQQLLVGATATATVAAPSTELKAVAGNAPATAAPKQRKSRKAAVADQKTTEAVVAEVEEVGDNGAGRVRKQVDKETVEADFKSVIQLIEEELERLRDTTDKSKAKGSKFLKSIKKRITTLQSHYRKVMKMKPKTNRNKNNLSGIMKPGKISQEMISFLGLDLDREYSRVEITKVLCNYVKANNLQDPTDRRYLYIERDANLARLLNYKAPPPPPPAPANETKEDKKTREETWRKGMMTYFRIQQHMGHLFPPSKKKKTGVDVAVETVAELAAAVQPVGATTVSVVLTATPTTKPRSTTPAPPVVARVATAPLLVGVAVKPAVKAIERAASASPSLKTPPVLPPVVTRKPSAPVVSIVTTGGRTGGVAAATVPLLSGGDEEDIEEEVDETVV